MYKLQLIRKYLLKRRIAWVALVAVMLCTAMVLVVVSVMGGWLATFLNSFHGMTGDVVITTPSLTGFPYYQEMIDRVKADPTVTGAVPIIRSGGLINFRNRDVEIVQVLGYPPDIGTVNNWPASLHLPAADRQKALRGADLSADKLATLLNQLPFVLRPDIAYENYVSRRVRNPRNWPAMIVSSALVGIKKSEKERSEIIRDNMARLPVTLNLVPITGGQTPDQKNVNSIAFWVVDDSASQIWQLDNNNVYISFAEAQRDLYMAGSPEVPATADAPAVPAVPARCSEVEIKAKPDTDLIALRDRVQHIVDTVHNQHSDVFVEYETDVMTWQEQQGKFIQAVQHEVVLTTALFGIISMVAVLLIFCIFYMIVIEKTKDIGIIKSVGATSSGILSLFLGYGLAIGIVGAGLGFTFAYFFVHYINNLHAWLARRLGVELFNADTYQFDKIPNHMDPTTVCWVLVIAVLSAVVGAMLPALRAAVMNPIDALRYE